MRSPGIRRGFVFSGNNCFSGWICIEKREDLAVFLFT
jgi:hypothetical protein